jgi:hypothetical protein
MTNLLKQAIQRVEELPLPAQQRIGEQLLLHVDKLRRLRPKIESAAHSLDRGGGRAVHISDVIKHARAQYGDT